jgi:hypothetical protein
MRLSAPQSAARDGRSVRAAEFGEPGRPTASSTTPAAWASAVSSRVVSIAK